MRILLNKKLIKRVMKRVRVLIINDLHDGSIHAICSEKPIAEGKKYVPNASQVTLLKGWKECIKMFKDDPPDVIVINGEPVEGNNKKGFSKELWSQELVDQVRDFKKLFDMIPQKYEKDGKIFYSLPKDSGVDGKITKSLTKIYLTRGSAYHVDIEGTPIEEFVGDYIHAETYNNLKANYHVQLRINGKLLSFAHETGYSKNYPARGNKLAQEWTTHAASAMSEKDKWDYSIRAHIHQINIRSFGTKWTGITCPAWKYSLGDYFERHGPNGIPADIGMTIVDVESNGDITHKFLIPKGVKLDNKVIIHG